MNVIERFLCYAGYHTTSDEFCENCPSTAGQLVLGKKLTEDMKAIGLTDVRQDEFGYVYGFLPGNCPELCEPLGLIAHMDTSPDVSGENVRPRIIRYEGGDIELGNGARIDLATFPFMEKFIGQDLIVTDGTTLLGADDKAGVAEILSACEYLLAHPEIKRRPLAVAFTPDEEIGRGADRFDVANFPARVAYTLDGGALGEIEYENFNAAGATVTVTGVNIHPGSAKNKMKNAVLMGAEFIARMPAAETPAHTEGYEGFYHISSFEGDESKAVLRMIIRDHDRARFEARKVFVAELCEYLNKVWGEGSFRAEIRDSYFNMKEKILPHMELIRNAEEAFREAGVEPKTVAIRGGTDGARLSFEGLPCPNLSTGGENFHGIHEFASVQAMEKMVETVCRLAGKK